MNLGSIYHRSAYTDCYALNTDEIIVNLRTGKDVTAVSLIHDDPFAGGCTGHLPWNGTPEPMTAQWELANNLIWSIKLRPKHKREQYYFSITAGEETLLMFEDGFYTPEDAAMAGRLKQYYKFPWLNSADVFTPPAWVSDTVWYQIMPDRFRKTGSGTHRVPLRKWADHKNIHFWDTFGGDLNGITKKLPYLKELGITGVYMTPIFFADSNHKYNTFSYDTIDPDFGTEEDLIELVDTAHALGIRVMLDAVFNHVGTKFPQWVDAVKKGPESPYFDWFFINRWPLPKLPGKTEDGRFFSFAFTPMMPKLNTNNPEVIDFCLQRCRRWVKDWHIDGIRFDVGNEVSHRFLKELNRGLKEINPEVFLLGEIWHDSLPWLLGDEYDSVMNYPFMESLHNFWLDNQTSRELMHSMNRCYTLYPEQVNNALFNFLDTHDTMRAVTRCGNLDVFYQQLALLMTMPGSACIYYGTEIALQGGNDPDNRRPMPWDSIEAGKHDTAIREISSLIALRKAYSQLSKGRVLWQHRDDTPRLVCYGRQTEGCDSIIAVYLNARKEALELPITGDILYFRKLKGTKLLPGGILICKQEVSQWGF